MNQESYSKTDDAGEFSASEWSKNNPPRFSDSRLVMLYEATMEFSSAEFGTFLLVA